jgi:hypothetical protein
MSSSTERSHDRTKACNTTYIVASQHTQPDIGGSQDRSRAGDSA